MSQRALFKLKACIAPLPGPGFATPAFQRGNDNGLWIQDIGDNGRVKQFLELAPRLVEESQSLASDREQASERLALYVFHGRTMTYIDTRARLEDPLRYEFERLEEFPYLRRSIGRFVRDEGLVARARRQIFDWSHTYNSARFMPWHQQANRFLRRDIFEQISERARGGISLVIHGRRGSGKTTLLAWLQEQLEANGRDVIRVSVNHHRSVVPALLEAGRRMPDWSEEAKERLDARAQLVWRNEPTADFDLATVQAFARLCASRERQVSLLLDDFDNALLDHRMHASTGALLAAARSSPRLQVIFALVMVQALEAFRHIAQPLHDYMIFELPDLSSSEVRQLTERMQTLATDDLAGLDAAALADRLAGFNVPEVMDMLREFTSTKDQSEDAMRTTVIKHCEMIFMTLDRSESAASLVLDAVERGQKDLRALQAIGESTDGSEVGRGLSAVILSGLVKATPEGRVEFRHRYVRDWWRARKRR
jgi:hypothetical protein